MPFKAAHATFVSYAVEVLPAGIAQVVIVETDLQLNPRQSSYSSSAVKELISAAQTYARANIEGLVHIRLVSTRGGDV